MSKSGIAFILLGFTLFFSVLSCNKNTKSPEAGEEEPVVTAPSTPSQPPWESMTFAENTPVKIKKEIYNWRNGVCTFADVYEYQFMEQPVYLLRTGCANDPITYLFDTTGTILCGIDGSADPQCNGTSFTEAYNKRFIWSSYNVFPALVSDMHLVNKQISLGERTFLEVHSLGASDGQCVIDRYEAELVGQTYYIKTFYKLPKSPASPTGRQTELRSNIEIKPSAKGVYIMRADSTSSIADTLIVL